MGFVQQMSTTNRAQAFKQLQQEVKLPSGVAVLVRQPNVESLITEEGGVPDTLFDLMFSGIEPDKAEAKVKQMSNDEKRAYLKAQLHLADQIVKQCFVSPMVVDSEPDYELDQIVIEDIPIKDRIYIMQWAMGNGEDSARTLARFRAEQRATLSTASDGGADGDTPKRDDGGNGSSDGI